MGTKAEICGWKEEREGGREERKGGRRGREEREGGRERGRWEGGREDVEEEEVTLSHCLQALAQGRLGQSCLLLPTGLWLGAHSRVLSQHSDRR